MTEQVPGRAISHVNSALVNNQRAGSVFETDQTTRSQHQLLECPCFGWGDIWTSNRRYKTQLVHLDLQLFEFELFSVGMQKQRGLQRLEAAVLSCLMLDFSPGQSRAHSIAHIYIYSPLKEIFTLFS